MQCAPLEFRFLLQNKRRGELVYSGVVFFVFFYITMLFRPFVILT